MERFNDKMASVERQVHESKISQEDAIISITKQMLQEGNTKTEEKVRELYDEGTDIKEIMEITGYKKSQVYEIINRIRNGKKD